MNEKIKKLLSKLGLSAEAIKDLSDDKDINIDELEGTVKETYKSVLMNDKSFIDPIHVEVTGKVKGSLETKLIRELGISSEEIEAQPKEKRIDFILNSTKSKLEAKANDKTSDEKDKEIEKLNATLLKKNSEIKKIREEEIPSLQTTHKKEINSIRINSLIEEEISKHKLIDINKNIAIMAVKNDIEKEVDLELTESNSVKVLQKGQQLDYFVDNKKADLSVLVASSLGKNNLLSKKNKTDDKIITPESDKKSENDVTLAGADAAKQRLAEFEKKHKG